MKTLLLCSLLALLSGCAHQKTQAEKDETGNAYSAYSDCMEKYARENALSKTSPNDITIAAQKKCEAYSRRYFNAVLADQWSFHLLQDDTIERNKATEIHRGVVAETQGRVYQIVVEARK